MASRRGELERGAARTRRRRLLAACALLLAAATALAIALTSGGAPGPRHLRSAAAAATHGQRTGLAAGAATHQRQQPKSNPAPPLRAAVGLRVLTFVDRSRRIPVAEGATAPRTLVTYVRYPALASRGGTDVRDAPLARAQGPYPLIVFGHGFAVTPGTYASLLQAWARAGFVVAAPAFPLENAHAPGGPNEADLPNQPADVSFVISAMLAQSAARTSPLAGAVAPAEIALSGQSDGGDTALAAAYDPAHRDPRVGAAVILSGAEIPGHEFSLPAKGPPLLAAQGTADTINPQALTDAFFGPAPRPKFELQLPGAEHLPPYTSQQPQLSVVERATTDFLDAYLRHEPGALARMAAAAAREPAAARLIAEP